MTVPVHSAQEANLVVAKLLRLERELGELAKQLDRIQVEIHRVVMGDRTDDSGPDSA